MAGNSQVRNRLLGPQGGGWIFGGKFGLVRKMWGLVGGLDVFANDSDEVLVLVLTSVECLMDMIGLNLWCASWVASRCLCGGQWWWGLVYLPLFSAVLLTVAACLSPDFTPRTSSMVSGSIGSCLFMNTPDVKVFSDIFSALLIFPPFSSWPWPFSHEGIFYYVYIATHWKLLCLGLLG